MVDVEVVRVLEGHEGRLDLGRRGYLGRDDRNESGLLRHIESLLAKRFFRLAKHATAHSGGRREILANRAGVVDQRKVAIIHPDADVPVALGRKPARIVEATESRPRIARPEQVSEPSLKRAADGCRLRMH
jgi:hypothetical protein